MAGSSNFESLLLLRKTPLASRFSTGCSQKGEVFTLKMAREWGWNQHSPAIFMEFYGRSP